ncbi:pentapeptide repeat-containing protein [Paenibacillus sp. HJGM_3]|uniref:pentapeptide repeat-containing protein n=1 Tax=Paenibacillus sp. HJGM_3 TaxID=3379816 RepID=UPI00385DC08F
MRLENEKKSLTVVNADVSGSSFKNVSAEQVAFQCCNLSGIRLNDVNLTGMTISDANLSRLDIDGAQWGGAHFRYIGFGNKDEAEPQASTEKPPVQFTHCNLSQGRFTDCNLSGVTLDNCEISGLVINGINIEKLLKQVSK